MAANQRMLTPKIVCGLQHSEMKPGVIYYTITSEADTLSRRTFWAEWLDDNTGPRLNEIGVRGQACFGNLYARLLDRLQEGKPFALYDAIKGEKPVYIGNTVHQYQEWILGR